MYKLLIEDNDRFQTVVPVTTDGITIGRNEGNTIRLPERNVSRKHAKITLEGDVVYFENVQARYGSEKNGRRVTRKEKFSLNDVFEVGDYYLRLEKVPTKASQKMEFDDAPTQVTQRPEFGDSHARLVVTSSNFAGQEFNLVYQSCIIGRDESCDIVIEHRSVSAHHARIEHDENRFTITDLHSSNGTAINGQLRNYHRLISGDIIDLGQVTLRFIGPGEAFTFVVPEAPMITERKMQRSTAIFGLIFAALVLIVAIASIAFFANPPDKKEVADPSHTVISESLTEAIDSLETVAGDHSQRVAEEIAVARGKYEQADMQGAIAVLVAARRQLQPNAKQRQEIDDLIDAARLEIEPSKAISTIRQNMEKEQWLDALDALESIQDTSTSPASAKYIAQNNIKDRVIDNAIKQALKGSPEDRTRAEMLLSSIDPNDPRLAKLDPAAPASASRKGRPTPTRRPTPVRRPTTPTPSDPKEEDYIPPRNSPERQEYISQLTSSAMKFLFKGEFAKSIRACRNVFRADPRNSKCNSIMGLNYEKTKDFRRACHYFKLAGAQEKLKKLNCR